MNDRYTDYAGDEIFIALVAPIGVDLEKVSNRLTINLKKYNFDSKLIKLSGFIKKLSKGYDEFESHYEEYARKIKCGDQIRADLNKKSFLAMMAVADIAVKRAGNKRGRTAYIINQIKLPEELEVLKYTYGSRFISLGLIANESFRVNHLNNKMCLDEKPDNPPASLNGRSHELIDRDNVTHQIHKEESSSFKQNISGTLDKTDYYLGFSQNVEELDERIKVFIDRFFRRPYREPSADEFAMATAYTASLRSMDMGKQIGAVIASEDGEIVSTGFNEVPVPGGGVYWGNKEGDERDFACGDHSLSRIKKEYEVSLINDLKAELKNHIENGGSNEVEKVIAQAVKKGLGPIIEFGRSVHAEMAAILEASREGKSVKGKTIYTTTYPCHLCTIQIIAAGISRIVYLEHYPKSRNKRMFPELMADDFIQPFLGVSPKIYVEVFSSYYYSGLKNSNGDRHSWSPTEEKPNAPNLYDTVYRVNEKMVCCCLIHVLNKSNHQKYLSEFKSAFQEHKDFTDESRNALERVYVEADEREFMYERWDKLFA